MGVTTFPPPIAFESLVESFAESLSVSDSTLLSSDSVVELLSLTDSESSVLELSVLEDSVEVVPLSQAAIVKQAKIARSKVIIFLFISPTPYSSKSPAS